MDRWHVFQALPRPSSPGAYRVEPAAGVCRVARNHDGQPAVLFAFPSGQQASAPRRLAMISYEPPRSLALSRDGEVLETARLAILECRTADPQLAAYFFRVVDSVLLDNGRLVDEARFDSALDAVVTLFRALQRPGIRSIQGLWAELAILAWAADPGLALSAWHSSPRALHDFSAGSFRLEVKSTLKSVREHTFLLDQLASMAPGITIVASLMLAEADDGVGVHELVEQISARAGRGTEATKRLEAIVAESLGQSWREAGDTRFSIEAARRSLLLYQAERVPTIPQPLPPAIKDVRFVADLSNVPPTGLDEARALGPLFGAVLPATP